MMKYKSFILYNDQWDAIRLLTYEQAGICSSPSFT